MGTGLFELGTEELPCGEVGRVANGLSLAVKKAMQEAGMSLREEQISVFYTPRRIALLLRELPPQSEPRTMLHQGPPVRICYDDNGEPTAAMKGFAAKFGIPVAALQKQLCDGVEKMVHRDEVAAVPCDRLLTDVLNAIMAALQVPGSMRWGDGGQRFLRPVRWLLAMLDEQILDVKAFGLAAGNSTRLLHPDGSLKLKSASQWLAALRKRGIEPDFAERLAGIRRLAAEAICDLEEGCISAPAGLEEEIANLVECPSALCCSFDAQHLGLPDVVIRAVLEKHQRYLCVGDKSGGLLPRFVVIANLKSTDPKAVAAGNERVVRPRLQDAGFFFARDCEDRLQVHCKRLENIEFRAGLGSLADKQQRLEKLAPALALCTGVFSEQDMADLKRAAQLCRMDQASQMVQEFPHLEGEMGAHFAFLQGESEAVCRALRVHHRMPAAEPDGEDAVSRMLVLADRLDSLSGLMAVGERPAADRDPLGLRRLALAIVRVASGFRLGLDPAALVATALEYQPVSASDETVMEAADFIRGRFEAHLDAQKRPLFAAVREVSVDLYDCNLRMAAITEFLQKSPQSAADLAEVVRRCHNLLRRQDSTKSSSALMPDAEPQERELHQCLSAVSGAVQKALKREDYLQAMSDAATLAHPLGRFFEEVMVMDERPEVRAFRLGLLMRCSDIFRNIADFHRIEIKRPA